MVIKKVELEKVLGISSKIEDSKYPEFAFAGKSNVGKSSLINAMLNRKTFARVSSKPGKTQTINYYNVNDELYLVDLPGYGYTTAGVNVRESWGKMVERYLFNSKMLKYVFLLIDSRHRPSENDILMYDWILRSGYSPIIIATKIDKLKRSQIKDNLNLISSTLKLEDRGVLVPFSSIKKVGIGDVWELITSACQEVDS